MAKEEKAHDLLGGSENRYLFRPFGKIKKTIGKKKDSKEFISAIPRILGFFNAKDRYISVWNLPMQEKIETFFKEGLLDEREKQVALEKYCKKEKKKNELAEVVQ